MQESDAIVGPVPLSTYSSWGLYQSMTHFRHTTVGNMAFLDGHVQTLERTFTPWDASWPTDAAGYIQLNKLGFPTTTNAPYNGNDS